MNADAPWTLVLPCAAPLDRDAPSRPKWLLTTPQGELLVARAATAIPATNVQRIVLAFTRDIEDRYQAAQAVSRAFNVPVTCIILEEQTQDVAQTVQETITRADITGPICVKDSDSFFSCGGLPQASFIAVADIHGMASLSSPAHKSYVRLNEQNLVTAVTEKDVTSNLISGGAYGFADAGVYQDAYARLRDMSGAKRCFVSHVVSMALLDGHVFLPHPIQSFVDIGTLGDWSTYRSAFPTIVLDIDGVIFLNQSHFFPPFWGDLPTPIAENVAHLRRLQATGAQFVFMTARPEAYRETTLAALARAGLNVHALVMGCHHGPRYLVNDYAASNPYPTALAVNLRRNRGDLPNLLLPEQLNRAEEI